MSRRSMETLREKMCLELDKIAESTELKGPAIDAAYKISCIVKNLDKILMCEDGGYSRDGAWEARGMFGYGNSFNDGGYSNRRDNMGRYSQNGSYGRGDYSRMNSRERMMVELEEAMNAATSEHEREVIRKAMENLRN